MSTYRLELHFVKPGKEDLLGPEAHIYVKNWTSNSSDPNKLMYITSQCVSYREMDNEIKKLERELSKLRLKAKKQFEAIQP